MSHMNWTVPMLSSLPIVPKAFFQTIDMSSIEFVFLKVFCLIDFGSFNYIMYTCIISICQDYHLSPNVASL